MIPSRTGPQICSVGRALPEHHVDQDSVLSAVHEVWRKQPNAQARRATIARLEPLHRALGVQERYFALPFSAYEEKRSFAQRNDVWIDVALDIGERAIVEALGKAGLGPKDVDHLFFVTVTGIAAPNIDARLVNRLRMRPDVKRTPIICGRSRTRRRCFSPSSCARSPFNSTTYRFPTRWLLASSGTGAPRWFSP